MTTIKAKQIFPLSSSRKVFFLLIINGVKQNRGGQEGDGVGRGYMKNENIYIPNGNLTFFCRKCCMYVHRTQEIYSYISNPLLVVYINTDFYNNRTKDL